MDKDEYNRAFEKIYKNEFLVLNDPKIKKSSNFIQMEPIKEDFEGI